MPEKNGTATSRSDSEAVKEQGSDRETAGESKSPEEAGTTADAEAQTGAAEELKVVVSIKGGRATVGVQQPSSDPHIETFEDADLTGLAQAVVAVTERAMVRWDESPKHPAYERPAPPARRRNDRQQGADQDQQQEPRLF